MSYLSQAVVDFIYDVWKIREEPLDGDDVEAIVDLVRIDLNHFNGNMTTKEYFIACEEWGRTSAWRFNPECPRPALPFAEHQIKDIRLVPSVYSTEKILPTEEGGEEECA